MTRFIPKSRREAEHGGTLIFRHSLTELDLSATDDTTVGSTTDASKSPPHRGSDEFNNASQGWALRRSRSIGGPP
ncbi:hypothetical protein TNCV_3990221 [Trichonephila clavipes]|uniref:Uncharacterized protein n=1 Tax=Trichonephila clavipes TaxID=2585209 RepID=A0A8X6VSD8_TRICX|nr:hypothetical protein TNCV_3990221 [Trichonephila clavipes]